MFTQHISTILLQAPAGAPPGGGMMFYVMMIGMFVVMYFFMIRPQQKRAKEQKSFADSIQANETVVTTAGIHARINRINEDGTLQLEIYRGSFMTVERSAVSMELTLAQRKKADAAAGITPATPAK
jgi:preprotein translocase subunit YajC